MDNYLKTEFPARTENEALSRMIAAAFVTEANPTVEELTDIRTAVSEAVTNAIIHGYRRQGGTVTMTLSREQRRVTIVIRDQGCGIADVEKAREPFFTSEPEEERSGMGFAVMEAFMDEVRVTSRPGVGTEVILIKTLSE